MLKVKKTLILALVTLFSVSLAFGQPGMGQGRGGRGPGRGANKLMIFQRIINKYKDEIGISEEKATQIEEILYNQKKESISKRAELQLTNMEIKRELDKQGQAAYSILETLIDKKYNIEKETEKSKVKSYIEVQKLLTDEERAKIEEIIEKKKEEMRQRRGRRGQGNGPKGFESN